MKRNSLKRFMSLGMAVVLTLAVFVTPKVNAAENDRFSNFPLEEDEDINQFNSSALDETYGFSDEAFAAIESLVITDDDNLYHIENEEELRNQLSAEEYSIVLERIKESNASVMASAAGTEKNPHVLTENTSFDARFTSGSNTWFKISDIRGAVDFIVSCNTSASVTIYKKTLFGKTQIAGAGGTSVKKTISASSINNNANTYIFNVSAGGFHNLHVLVRQHRDATNTYYPNGGTIWKPNNLSANPNTREQTKSIWYLKAEDVHRLSTFINNDNYLKFVDGFMKGTMTAASIATAIWGLAGGGDAATVVGFALTIISATSALSFQQELRDKLNAAGGWNGTKFTKSICLKEVLYVDSCLKFYYVSTWDGGVFYGEPGYTGTFSPSGR